MIAYLDSSAFVKLVKREKESEALADALRRWPDRASSWLLHVEVLRAARLAGEDAFARAVSMLDDIALLPVSQPILERAAGLAPTGMRTLDAIHVATSLVLADDLGVLISYDERMLAAANDASIESVSPR